MSLRDLLPMSSLPALGGALLLVGGCFDGASEVGRVRSVPSFASATGLRTATSYDGVWQIVTATSASGQGGAVAPGTEFVITDGRLDPSTFDGLGEIDTERKNEHRVDFLTNGVDEAGLLRYRLGETIHGWDLGLGVRGEHFTTVHRSITCVVGQVDAQHEIDGPGRIDEGAGAPQVGLVAPAPSLEVLTRDGNDERDLGDLVDGVYRNAASESLGPTRLSGWDLHRTFATGQTQMWVELRLQVRVVAFELDSSEPFLLVDDELVLTARRIEHALQAR